MLLVLYCNIKDFGQNVKKILSVDVLHGIILLFYISISEIAVKSFLSELPELHIFRHQVLVLKSFLAIYMDIVLPP